MAEVQVRALMALARAKTLTTQQDNQQQQHRDALAILVAWFGSKAAIGAKRLPDELLSELAKLGINPDAAGRAGQLTLEHPLSGRTRAGSPEAKPGMTVVQRVASEEPEMRAEYLLAAADRLTDAIDDDTFDRASKREETYAAQHAAAGRNRRAAARKVDDLDASVLVWRTVMDDRTTPDCAALNNRLFTPSNPPGIPGAMHPACRCTAERWGGLTGHMPELLGGG